MTLFRSPQTATLSAILLASLAACGGGSGIGTELTASAGVPAASAADTPASGADTPDSTVAAVLAQTEVLPTYHLAPALLDEPSQVDVGGTNVSAHAAPQSFDVDASVSGIDTARLTPQGLAQRLAGSARARAASVSGSAAPAAAALTGAVFTPAQIRAAYGLPALPAVGAAITPAMAASLGAGQTIYLLDAYHDATALSDLNAFSTRFGLPTCTNVAVAPAPVLPLAKPPSTCTFSAVHSAIGGTMTATAPAYNVIWAPESKLDVQWAHAIAPLARLVLIELPGAMSNNILDANVLAGKLGAGVVSMSFGSVEAGWASTVDYHFTTTGMTYVAATGDSGSQVLWPAVSPNVVAVGGTGLNWTGSGTRYEIAWGNSGGGMSAYEALPAWQSGVTAAGGGKLTRRAVPDVAFNADPMTGEYVALTLPGASTVWLAYGGTSIAAPQWAGIVAVANAMRVASSKTTLGDVHALLYKSIAAVPGNYAAGFGDIVSGTNGTCATCRAGVGFDETTGLGTPNASGLLQLLTGTSAVQSAPVAAAPVVPGGSYAGKVGTALSQSLGITAPAGVTTSYALSGAPGGLSVDGTGTLKWAAPVSGSYSFTATASTSAGKSASATYALKVIPGAAPAISTTALTASVSAAFAGSLSATNPNGGTLTYTVTGAPAGLATSTTGAMSWAKPVAGVYSLTVRVADNYGYSATKTVTLNVAAAAAPSNHAPTLASSTLAEKAGATFAVRLAGQDADGNGLTYTATGMPGGAMLLPAGILTWSSPVKGSYAITVTVHDTHGATGSAVIRLTVS